MALKVYTGTIYNYKGIPDGLDISVKSAPADGQPFIPTWQMVLGQKDKTISVEEYAQQYREKMRNSYKINRIKWKELLGRNRVTLLCYCHTGDFCHRYLLAAMLVLMGAEYMGEAVKTNDGILIDKSTIEIVNFWVSYFKNRRS